MILLVRAVLALLLLSGAARAAEPTFQGPFTQGGLVQGRAAPGSTVTMDGERVPVAEDGLFLLGFGRDAPPRVDVAIVEKTGTIWHRTFNVKPRRYDVQRVNGLPEQTVTPDPEGLKRIAADREQIVAVRNQETLVPFFLSGFQWPAIGPISGVFGSQRILNGQARAPHNGVDVAAPVGTPIVAAADGMVVLAEPDMILTGKTVLIDHGLGLTTNYLHMSELDVKPGDRVAKGQMIGRIGATGRVSGPHLHWGATLHQTAIDPALLVGPMPSPQ
ncbi:MAG: M23 family metallopeptidase [Alphaproteobacteria bacterium]|nr:M23 family metallopeptidase [Alphaproteobacteria bacterium]